MVDGITNVLKSTTLSPSSLSVVQVGTLPKFLEQWRGITSNRLCLILLIVTIFSLGATLNYSIIWKFKSAAGHHPITQEEVDELLAKGATEPLTGGAGFQSNAFVVPRCTGDLWPILNLKQSNCYKHILTF